MAGDARHMRAWMAQYGSDEPRRYTSWHPDRMRRRLREAVQSIPTPELMHRFDTYLRDGLFRESAMIRDELLRRRAEVFGEGE